MLYLVKGVCDNRNCINYGKFQYEVTAITEQVAQQTMGILENEDNNDCEVCGRNLFST